LQADAGTGVKLAGVVTPQKRSKAAWSQDNRWKKRADNGLDGEAESAPPVCDRTQRLAKKVETKGWALPAVETGHTTIWMGVKAKEIKKINSKELDDEGAQAQADARHAGKTAKSPKTNRWALTPMKKDRQMVGTEAKANDGMGGNWDDSDAKSPGGRANNESSLGYDTPPPSLRWGMEELQQTVYQERTAASVFAAAVTNAHLLGMEGVNKAEAAIQAILNPWRGGPTALEGALDPELSKARAYIAILADYQLGFTLLYNLQWVNQELRPGNPIRAWVVVFRGEVWTNGGTPDVLFLRKTRGPYSKGSTYPGSW
jgi:hypothetical protein